MSQEADPNFNPTEHHATESRYFDDLAVGERFLIPSRTLGDANFSAFQALSLDNHPIHYDLEYCKRAGHKDLLAHGLQVSALCAPGAGRLPHELHDSLIGLLEHSAKFLNPVYRGDTVYPALEIIELAPSKNTGVITLRVTVHNQNRQLVLEGLQKMLVRKRA
tara:strand:+ start:43 stop:531 length:489 start_codon:yes stop_codon:yes gene_type:complete